MLHRTVLRQEASDRARQRGRPANGGDDPQEFCKETEYRKRTLKAIKDAPFIGLFNDLAVSS
jgi:hypothetical protein